MRTSEGSLARAIRSFIPVRGDSRNGRLVTSQISAARLINASQSSRAEPPNASPRVFATAARVYPRQGHV